MTLHDHRGKAASRHRRKTMGHGLVPGRPGFEDLQKLKERHAKLKSALDDLLARQKIADLYKVLGRL